MTLHAPELPGKTFEAPGDFDDLCKALFMVWDLIRPGREELDSESTAAFLYQDFASSRGESAREFATRAYHFYQLHRPTPSDAVSQLKKLFEQVTGTELADFLLGGISVALKEQIKVPEELAMAWQNTLSPDQCNNPLETRCLRAYHRLRSGNLERIRSLIEEHDGEHEMAEQSLIGMAKCPIMEADDGSRYVLNLSSVAESLFEGVRHEILSYATRNPTSHLNQKSLGTPYGTAFQDYVFEILASAFGDRFVRLDESERERADGLICYPDKLVVIEIKGGRARGLERTNLFSLTDRASQLRRLGVEKAASQIAETIKALRSYVIRDKRIQRYRDWTIVPIIPVIVTLESLPLVWGLWDPLYKPLFKPLDGLRGGGVVARVRLLSVSDVEKMPDLAEHENVASILLLWANDPDLRECSLSDFLSATNRNYPRAFFKRRFAALMTFVSERFGLDSSKFKVDG